MNVLKRQRELEDTYDSLCVYENVREEAWVGSRLLKKDLRSFGRGEIDFSDLLCRHYEVQRDLRRRTQSI